MLKNALNYELMSYENYELKTENFFLTSVFENIMKHSNDEIIVCDSKLNIILSNSKILSSKDSIINKLRLKIQFFENDNKKFSFTRSVATEQGRLLFNIFVTKIYTQMNVLDGYVFIMRNITNEEKFKMKFENIISFLKHDLKTPLISEIMALKLVLKSSDNWNLLPEILNSCETAHRMLQNHISESTLDDNSYKIVKKEINLKTFIDNGLLDCQNFLQSKNNKIEVNDYKLCKINVDAKALKAALINILFQISDRCKENSTIHFGIDSAKRTLRIKIEAEFEIFDKNIFSVKDFNGETFRKIGSNNGLYLAGCIVNAHQGRIFMKKEEKNTVIKIFLPA